MRKTLQHKTGCLPHALERTSDKENIREIGPGSGISARSQIQKLELTQRLKNLMRAIRSSGRMDRANAGLTLCTNYHGKPVTANRGEMDGFEAA